MSKRHADETDTNDAFATASQVPLVLDDKIPKCEPLQQQSEPQKRKPHKRLHLNATQTSKPPSQISEKRIDQGASTLIDNHIQKPAETDDRGGDSSRSDDISDQGHDNSFKSQKSVSSSNSPDTKGQRLFEQEAQDTILNMACLATSTLMIQVYHRCFGKCIGLHYPTLLKHSQSACIQCVTCNELYNPVQFVDHTHGPKEVNVCHWGFDSTNWRSYIRLSKKQSMNNLDEDELLVQFNRLKSIRDYVEVEQRSTFQEVANNLKLKSTDKNNDDQIDCNNLNTGWKQSSRVHISAVQYQAELDGKNLLCHQPVSAKASTSRDSLDELARLSEIYGRSHQVDRSNISKSSPTDSDKKSYLWDLEQVFPTHGESILAADLPIPRCRPEAYSTTSLPYGHSILTPARVTSNNQYHKLGLSAVSSRSDFSLSSLNLIHGLYAAAAGSNSRHSARPMTTPSTLDVTGQATQLTADRFFKQDLFVTTGLTRHLNSKGFHPHQIEEIVDSTIGLIQKARAMF